MWHCPYLQTDPGFNADDQRMRIADCLPKMEACLAVEREVDKVLAKFNDVDKQTVNTINNLVSQIENIKEELIEGRLFTGI